MFVWDSFLPSNPAGASMPRCSRFNPIVDCAVPQEAVICPLCPNRFTDGNFTPTLHPMPTRSLRFRADYRGEIAVIGHTIIKYSMVEEVQAVAVAVAVAGTGFHSSHVALAEERAFDLSLGL